MTHISLSDVHNIYSLSSQVQIKHQPVKHHDFGSYCLLLRKFECQLSEADKDDYWKNFLQLLRRYRFDLCAAPLPFNHPTVYSPETSKFLRKHLARCQFIYPDLLSSASELVNCLEKLSHLDSNPLLDSLKFTYKKDWQFENVTLLLKESRLIPVVEKILATRYELRRIEIVVPSQLRGSTCYKNLVVIGPTRWFPEYVFSAPRASAIQVLHYSWIRDKWTPKPVFIGSTNLPESKQELFTSIEKRCVNSTTSVEVVVNYFEPEELLPPSINWSQIARGFPISSLPSLDQQDTEARLFVLEGSVAVFLDNESKVIVIALEEDGESQVKRISVADIEIGIFIISRTSGGGDYIISLADRILREEAQRVRGLQNLWKIKLKSAVTRHGLQTVSRHLIRLGSQMAKNEQNIRNWMSERIIRPKDDKDFNAILRLVGLGERLDEFHVAARLLDSAHRSAGKHIRKLLLHQVDKANIHKLEHLGRMEFELDEADGGSLTAFRVVDIAPQLNMIPASKIAQVFEIYAEVNNG